MELSSIEARSRCGIVADWLHFSQSICDASHYGLINFEAIWLQASIGAGFGAYRVGDDLYFGDCMAGAKLGFSLIWGRRHAFWSQLSLARSRLTRPRDWGDQSDPV